MNNTFDELAKGMAQSLTRRAALKKSGVGLAGITWSESSCGNLFGGPLTLATKNLTTKPNEHETSFRHGVEARGGAVADGSQPNPRPNLRASLGPAL